MDVQNSILNSSTFLCVPPDGEPTLYSAGDFVRGVRRDRAGYRLAARTRETTKIQNDGGELIGNPVGPKGDLLSETNVQNALAQSSNTAFTDLAHRTTTTDDHSDGEQLRRQRQ